jgi:GYF domain 2
MANRQWYTAIDGQQAGPYSDQRLGEMVAAGLVRADTYVWCAGMTEWASAGDIPGLIPRSRPAPPPPPRQPPRGPQQPAPRAAAPRQGPGGQQAFGASNFGGTNFGASNFGAPDFNQEEAAKSIGQAFSQHVPADAAPLVTHVTMWPLIGRTLLVILGQITIIPAPWIMTSFYKWFIENIELPEGRRTGFNGQPMDIWYIFMLYAFVAGYSGYIIDYVFTYIFLYLPFFYAFWEISTILTPLIKVVIIVVLLLIILKWVVQNTVWEGQTGPLNFTGSYLGMLGWYVFTAIAVFTIIGWAWVAAAWMRWMCRHLVGGAERLVFTATGWEILWRTWLFAISCFFIIPIPWTLHWITRWYISQFALSREQAPA